MKIFFFLSPSIASDCLLHISVSITHQDKEHFLSRRKVKTTQGCSHWIYLFPCISFIFMSLRDRFDLRGSFPRILWLFLFGLCLFCIHKATVKSEDKAHHPLINVSFNYSLFSDNIFPSFQRLKCWIKKFPLLLFRCFLQNSFCPQKTYDLCDAWFVLLHNFPSFFLIAIKLPKYPYLLSKKCHLSLSTRLNSWVASLRKDSKDWVKN